MTTAPHRWPASYTDGDDARVRLRVVENPRPGGSRSDPAAGSAHARAIQDNPPKVNANGPGKIRNFAQQHAEEARSEFATGWLGASRHRTLNDTLDTTIPTRAEAGSAAMWPLLLAARLFKLAVHTIAYLMREATGTDKRAAVALALTLLTFTATLAAAALAGH